MQGLVNTLADLQGVFAAVTRVNNVVGRAEVDEWLAHGLEREARGELQSSDECASAVDTGVVGPPVNGTAAHSLNYGSKKSVCELAWSGDVVLESKFVYYWILAISTLMVNQTILFRCFARCKPCSPYRLLVLYMQVQLLQTLVIFYPDGSFLLTAKFLS